MNSQQNRCWGLVRNLHRCGRVGEWRLFCHEHRRQPIVWLFVLIFTVVAGIASITSAWFPRLGNEHSAAAAVPPPRQLLPPKPLTLHYLFEHDFTGGDYWGFTFLPRNVETRYPDGRKTSVRFQARLFVDQAAATKFVSLYVEQSLDAYNACMYLAGDIQNAGGLNLFHMETQGGMSEPVFSKDFPFSGRVFIYHENLLTPEQSDELHKAYAEKKLILQLRGEEYVQLENLRNAAVKAPEIRTPGANYRRKLKGQAE
jgi:hypothetical protein